MRMGRYYVALDLHGRYVHVCEFRPDAPAGKQERHRRFPNTPEAWTAFVATLDRDAVVSLEVTSGAFEVYDLLAAHAGQVLVANPGELRRLGSGRHTDRVDAAGLAKMAALGVLPTVWVPPQPMRQVRRLLKTRERLVSQRQALLNQARVISRRYGVAVPLGAGPEALRASVVATALPAGEGLAVELMVDAAQVLAVQVETLTAEMARQVAEVPAVRLLLTITGVGLLGAAAIWAKLGDPRRFRGPKQVARYAGLDPKVEQSGQRDRRGGISRHGDRLLRQLLVEAAWAVARYDQGALGRFFRRKALQVGPRKAVVAVARKLLVVAWRMLQTGEVYRAEKPAAVQRKLQVLRRWTERGGELEATRQRVMQAALARAEAAAAGVGARRQ